MSWARRHCPECGTVLSDGKRTLSRGPLQIDLALRDVSWRGAAIRLTPTEFDILALLAQRAGRIVQSWAFFIDIIDEEIEDKILDVYICKLRAKFRAVDPSFDALETSWGEGYRWKIESEISEEAQPVDHDAALRARLQRGAL